MARDPRITSSNKTLAEAARRGADSVAVYCRNPCGRSHEWSMADALKMFGGEAMFQGIVDRVRCRGCGLTATEAAPGWPLNGAQSFRPHDWDASRRGDPPP